MSAQQTKSAPLPHLSHSRNELRALDALFRAGSMSRADLARALDLNRSTTGTIVAALATQGLVSESEPVRQPAAEARTGRPGITVSLNPEGASFIGAEIGVDHLTMVAIDLRGRTIRHRSLRLDTPAHSPDIVVATVATRLSAFIRGLPDRSLLRGICVTIPALVEDGVVRNAAMIGWRDVPLRDMLRRALGRGLPLLVENDANGFAVAETYRDGGRRSDAVAFILVENGAGAGLVIGGRLYRGSAGFAGEFGQLVMGGRGFAGPEDRAARLEDYIGKDALLARFRGEGGTGGGLEELLSGLARGEEGAVRAAADWGDWLARGLMHLTSLFNPGHVILGGSVAAVFPAVADRVAASMRREAMAGFPVPSVAVSQLGPDGSALGGALLLHQLMFAGETP